jgi:hypothetical protein
MGRRPYSSRSWRASYSFSTDIIRADALVGVSDIVPDETGWAVLSHRTTAGGQFYTGLLRQPTAENGGFALSL